MNDSWCLGVTHFARRRGGERGGREPGEICSGQHEPEQGRGWAQKMGLMERESGGGEKRSLRTDPTTQERAEMSPGDTRISHHHSILQHPWLHCPKPSASGRPSPLRGHTRS